MLNATTRALSLSLDTSAALSMLDDEYADVFPQRCRTQPLPGRDQGYGENVLRKVER
jgi:hypothetical protein